ncbi:MAG: regulatory signaling modulator protein AmpE [Woeseiaceae bacterium]|nr:regulatory signaling modulator protein AmpE [Woeseiaceae bacterium]
MKLIALLIGLVIERLATQFFHWRRMRWLDRIIDSGFKQAQRVANWPPLIPVLLLAGLLVLPVFAVIFILGSTLAGFTYLLLAVVVLFFSLGPKDIGEEVDEYCKALESEDEETIHNAAKAIVEGEVPTDARERVSRVEESICVQANNHLFAVVFWFIFFGPLGAWAYRVTDLIRRRAVFNASRDEETQNDVTQHEESEQTEDTVLEGETDSIETRDDEINGNALAVRDAAVMLHGWLAWIPARLTAVGYAAAGHFDEAIAAMRAPTEQRDATTSEHSENLLARVGTAALALEDKADETITERGVRGAVAANGLVFRQLIIWAVIISAMTLYGFTR